MTKTDIHISVQSPTRIHALDRTGMLDSPPEEKFDRVTRLVAQTLRVPVSLISFVASDKQFFKSHYGLPAPWCDQRQTPLSHSFCQYVVGTNTAFTVNDARQDERVRDNLAVSDLNVVAYLGVPLRDPRGHALGSLCAIDTEPREWTESDERNLKDFAAVVEQYITLSESEDQWRRILNAIPQIVWSALPDGYHDFYNSRWYEFTGVAVGSTDGEGWNGMFHPADQDRAWQRWRHSLTTGDAYEIEYRLRHHTGEYRWVLGRALPIRDGNGRIERWIGTCTDIEDFKNAEADRHLLARELSHRIKNIFAVVQGLIAFSVREHPELQDLAAQLRNRISALSAAHKYVDPGIADNIQTLNESERRLPEIIATILAPYQKVGAIDRIVVQDKNLALNHSAATAMALILHELATNAAKYGGLSTANGTVSLICESDQETLTITWLERGLAGESSELKHEGFGSELLRGMAKKLGSTIQREHVQQTLTVKITTPLSSLLHKKQ